MDHEELKRMVEEAVAELSGGLVLAFVAGEHQRGELREFEPLLDSAALWVCDLSPRTETVTRDTAQRWQPWSRFHANDQTMRRLVAGRKFSAVLNFTKGGVGDWAADCFDKGVFANVPLGDVVSGTGGGQGEFQHEQYTAEDLGLIDLE